MAVLTGGTETAVRLDLLNIGGWLAGTVGTHTPTAMTVNGPGGGFRQFIGTGFAYGGDGLFNAGMVNSIAVSNAGGGPWSISGMAMPVATLKSYVSAGDEAGFLGAVFAGDDVLSGHATIAFNDYLDGFGGQDRIAGGAGNDTLRGNLGNDTLDGGSGSDTLLGGEGSDMLGGLDADRMEGGTGDDQYFVESKADVVVEALGSGIDTVYAQFSYVLGANVENLSLIPLSATDRDGTGNILNNRIEGNNGRNVLNGLAGADILIGRKGDDTYVVDSAMDVIDEATGGGGNDTVISSLSFHLAANGTTVKGDFENLILTGSAADGFGNDLDNAIEGSGVANEIYGDGGDDNLLGLGGNDSLFGESGDDNLDGSMGLDRMSGGDGNDTYDVDNAGDEILEGSGALGGHDTVYASASYALTENVEDLIMWSFIGPPPVTAMNGTGNSLNNQISGNELVNTLLGLGGNDTLKGEAGNDTLEGGAGADKMYGGGGNDTYVADSTDLIDETGGSGLDSVNATTTFNLFFTGGEVENLTLLAGAGNIDGYGNHLANTITGNEGNNILGGLDGKDTLNGGNGDDLLFGGGGDDVLGGWFGNDTLDGGHGTNTINLGTAGAGNETVLHGNFATAYDIIQSFDGNPLGGQDVFDLNPMFDILGVATADRAGRVFLNDKGASVEVRIDTNGDGAADYLAATIFTADAVTIGQDVLVGTM